MNKYKSGKGRNPVQNPRTGVAMYYAGFGHRLLASAIPEMRDAHVRLLPCHDEPSKSLRARRRAGETDQVGLEPSTPEERLHRFAMDLLRANPNPFPVVTARQEPPGFRAAMDFAQAEDRTSVVILDSLSQMRERGMTIDTERARELLDSITPEASAERLRRSFPANRAMVTNATIQAAAASVGVFHQAIGRAARQMTDAVRMNITGPNGFPNPGDEGYVIYDSEGSYSGEAYSNYLQSLLGETPKTLKERKAAAKAEEKRKIKERLAGREVGQVIRRPSRTVAGIRVIDAMAEDGTVARTVVKSGEK